MHTIGVVLTLAGLLTLGYGAWITAEAVVIRRSDAEAASRTSHIYNPELRQNLIAQSRAAKRGLRMIVYGAALQFIGTAVSLLA